MNKPKYIALIPHTSDPMIRHSFVQLLELDEEGTYQVVGEFRNGSNALIARIADLLNGSGAMTSERKNDGAPGLRASDHEATVGPSYT